MASLGTIVLALALGATILTIGVGTLGGITGRRSYAEFSRSGIYVLFGLVALASAALLFSFLAHDFSLKYVNGRSDTRMPLHYVLSAFYGGQEGSLLFWVLVSSGFSAAAAASNTQRSPKLMSWFHAVVALGLLGFILILNFVSHPFSTFFILDAPFDGEGLNPLLQTPLMTIHPPMLLAGFATAIVPFAFGMASLLAGQHDSRWLKATRRWTLISWLILGIGNILGGMWAYRELGWGGYWAWDAVENAALVPWLVGTAFVHSVIVEEQRGMLKRWNVILVSLIYLLTLLGTWMTRSGLIDSVHTFAESDIGHFFLAHFLVMSALAVGLIIWRWNALKPDDTLDDAFSREGMFVFNNWLFVGMAGVVLFGTLYPKFAEVAFDTMITYGPPFFNRAMAPLAMILLVLMALGTILPWRRTTGPYFAKHATIPIIATVVLTPTLMGAYWLIRGKDLGVEPTAGGIFLSVLCFTLIVLNGVIIVDEFFRGTRMRMKKGEGDVLSAFIGLFGKFRRRYGGYLAHIGILMIMFAFIGNALKVEKDVTLQVGDSVELTDLTITYDGIDVQRRDDYVATVGTMRVFRGDKLLASLTPSRFDYNDYARLPEGRQGDMMKITSEIFIRSTPLEDLYVTMLNFDPNRQTAAFKVEVFPFTMWMWVGGLFMILGVAIAIWPEEDPLRVRYRRLRRLGNVANVIAVAVIMSAPLFVLSDATWVQAQPNAASAPPVQQQVSAGSENVPERSAANAPHLEGAGAPTSGPAEVPDDIETFLSTPVDLSSEQRLRVERLSSMVMTTCEGCAGKTLTLASPSCVPANIDKQRIRGMIASGLSDAQVLDEFVEARGQSALALPRAPGQKRIAWLIPGAILGVGLVMALVVVLKRRRDGDDSTGAMDTTNQDVDDPYLRQLREEVAAGEV